MPESSWQNATLPEKNKDFWYINIICQPKGFTVKFFLFFFLTSVEQKMYFIKHEPINGSAFTVLQK